MHIYMFVVVGEKYIVPIYICAMMIKAKNYK